MLAGFVAKGAGGNSPAPSTQHERVGYSHRGRQLRIKIDFQLRGRYQLVTHVAVLRLRRDTGIGAVTGEANCVTVRNRFERSFFQPKVVAQILRRFGDVLFAGISLRLIGLVTDGTALRWSVFLFLERGVDQPTATLAGPVETDDINVFVVRKADAEFRNKLTSFEFSIANVAETGKKPASGIARAYRDVTVRTNGRRRPLARKELRAVAIQTRRMLGKIGDVWKGRVARPYFLPILCRNLVAGVASEFLSDGMSLMRKLCIVDAWSFWRGDFFLRARALRSLRFSPARAGSGRDEGKH